jgi:hypothetical protein
MFKRFIIYICTILTLNFLISSSTKLFGQIPTDGPVAYYPFDGNTDDMSGNNNNGTIMGGVTATTDRFGNPDKAMQFNGVDGYIEVQNSSSLKSPTSAITMAGWIYIESFPSNQVSVAGFINKTNNSNYGQYGLNYHHWATPSTIHFYGSGGTLGYAAPVNLQLGEWYFMASTYDGNEVSIYLNGQKIGTQTVTGSIVPDNNPLTLGLDSPGDTEYLQGKLDDVRIYNGALSQSEISELYQEGGWPLNQGLVAYYPFDGNANDMSGSGNDGITNGDVEWFPDRFGNLRNSAKLNNYTAFISVNNFPFLDNEFSLTGWIKPIGEFLVDQNFLGSFCSYGEVYTHAWNFSYDNSLKRFNFWDNRNGTWLSPYIINNDWVFVAIIYNQGVEYLYVNGTLLNSKSVNTPLNLPSSSYLRMGMLGGTDQPFNGAIDDFRLFNRALSESEISVLYHENGWNGNQELNTIIITHGFTGEGIPPLNPITETRWKHLRWQFAMAAAVSDNRDIYLIRKGNVYAIEATFAQFDSINSDSTIEYVTNNFGVSRSIDSTKDNVFIFDWTLESAVNVHGFAEAAADVLAATLVKLGTEYDFILDNLHFIGHSRGCVVNSEAIQRLIYWGSCGMLPNGVNLDTDIHMTTLDAHPAGHWSNEWLIGDFVYMDDDHVNSFNIGVAGWQHENYLTKYIDNYFETNFWAFPPFNPFIGLDSYPGLSLNPPSNNNLSEKLPTNGGAHPLVHTWYFGTVDTTATLDEFNSVPEININRTEWYENEGRTQGFRYSRNRQGPLSDITSVQNELIDVNSDSKLFSSGFILNGDFTDFERYTLNNNFKYNFPGWCYQDGISSHLGGFFNPAARLSNSYPVLMHNSLYIPESSTECVFRMRVDLPLIPYSIKDELEIYLDDILIKSIPINSFELNYKWTQTNIPDIFKGKTCSLTFKLKKNNQSNNSRVDIDDIGLHYNTRISSTVACPVDFHIYDNLGNHTGPLTDSTYAEDVPGSEYYIYEDSTGDNIKTVYLEPLEGTGEYTFVIASRDTTSHFTYAIEDYSDTSKGTVTFMFDSIAIEPNTIATCNLDVSTQIPSLEVDLNGDGTIDTTYIPAVITAVDNMESQELQFPKEYSLSQNYPNPFNPATTIRYYIPNAVVVKLIIYDLLGREVKTLVNDFQQSGEYTKQFDGGNLSSGVYFYTLQAGDFVQTKKLILLK